MSIPSIRLRTRALGIALAFLLAASSSASAGQQASVPDGQLTAEIDSLMNAAYTPDRPGAAVVVVKDGKVVYRKGFGLANLELAVPMKPEMVFEIGSVTKQFTSTAVLMLVEEGKVSLEDDITKYFPEYPHKGAKITVENLLNHTSGIKSYTDTPKWLKMWRQDMTPQEIIDLTKDEPLEFKPGTKWRYNNTGYVMLGAIIERVSGAPYADFIRKNIFEPLGMTHSSYGSNTAVVPNRASGYSKSGDGYTQAQYLSMTQPYAAGSLMSTVDDLRLWDDAVTAGKLLTKGSWDRAFAPTKLASGGTVPYGYGWGLDEYEGRKIIRHNGGIPGYISEALRMPSERVYVAMLTNTDAPPTDTGLLVTKIAAATIGKPYKDPVAVKLDEKLLETYTGVYQIDDETTRAVTREGTRLFVQRTGRPKSEIFASSETDFFLTGSPQRFSFAKDSSGRVTGMVSRLPYSEDEVARKTDKPLPAPVATAKVDPKVLAAYVGQYQLMPGMVVAVTIEGEDLMAQATGQPKVKLVARAETEFEITEVGAKITFVKDASGKVGHLVLRQGGQELPAERLK